MVSLNLLSNLLLSENCLASADFQEQESKYTKAFFLVFLSLTVQFPFFSPYMATI